MGLITRKKYNISKKAEKPQLHLDQVDWAWSEVDSDDYGDKHWNYLIIYYYKAKELWSEYTHEEPDDKKCYDILLEAKDAGCFQEYQIE